MGWSTIESCATVGLCQSSLNSGSCASPACTTGEAFCDGVTLRVCNAERTQFEDKVCATPALCQEGKYVGECKTPACDAGEKRCEGSLLRNLANLPAACSAKTAYVTDTKPPSGISLPPDLASALGVDWCDASAYCSSKGRRLCGKIGGGALQPADVAGNLSAVASVDQWVHTCSSGGANPYPSGDTFLSCAPGYPPTPACEPPTPPYSGVHWLTQFPEWVDACDGTNCLLRGASSTGQPGCNDSVAQPRVAQTQYVPGFRCCSNP